MRSVGDLEDLELGEGGAKSVDLHLGHCGGSGDVVAGVVLVYFWVVRDGNGGAAGLELEGAVDAEVDDVDGGGPGVDQKFGSVRGSEKTVPLRVCVEVEHEHQVLGRDRVVWGGGGGWDHNAAGESADNDAGGRCADEDQVGPAHDDVEEGGLAEGAGVGGVDLVDRAAGGDPGEELVQLGLGGHRVAGIEGIIIGQIVTDEALELRAAEGAVVVGVVAVEDLVDDLVSLAEVVVVD